MRKNLGKKIAGVALAGAMAFTTMAAPIASAAAVTTSGDGKIYAPADTLDIVVPTSFKIAMNPTMVDIKANTTNAEAFGLVGKTQILSGVYGIENRSTIPVGVKVDFTVTPGGATLGNEALVASTDAAADQSKVKATFSLGINTTAAGTVQKLKTEPGTDTTPDTATGLRSDPLADAGTLAKASTEAIKFVDAKGVAAAKLTKTFVLKEGPYTANYVAETDTVSYTAPANATFDTVAFSFTGTTTTNLEKWVGVAAPKVAATYTVTKMTKNGYQSTGFSNIWKAVQLDATDATGGIIGSKDPTGKANSNAKITFKTGAPLAVATKKVTDGDGNTVVVKDYAKTNIIFQSLQTDAQKYTVTLEALGVDDDAKCVETGDATTGYTTVFTVTAANLAALAKPVPAGYYLVTIGKDTAIVYYGA